MGSGASTLNKDEFKTFIYRGLENENLPKWLSAEDISDLRQAKDEISRLRKLAHEHFHGLNSKGIPSPTADIKKARAAVMDRGQAFAGEYEQKVIPKDNEVQSMLSDIVNTNILFRHCKREDKKALVDAFEMVECEAGKEVIRQGDQGEDFFVVQTGQLDVYLGELKVGNQLISGTSFGELALMYNTPRAATIKATTACTLWRIDRSTFRGIVTHFQAERTRRYVKFLSEVDMKNLLSKQGVQTLGEVLSKEQLEHLAGALEEEKFQQGEFIIRQGTAGDYFYILEEGEVDVHVAPDGCNEPLETTKVATLNTPGQYFGEKALLSEDKRQASCLAKTETKCLTLAREDFVMMLGKLDDLVNDHETKEEPALDPVVAGQERETIELRDLKGFDCTKGKFADERILGCGAFGRVKLVQHTESNKTYALKIQSKKAIVENSLQDHILNERLILLKLSHPFILTLFGAFKDDCNIYFLLELLLGGELFSYLRNRGELPESEAKFYGAQVLTAFAHLHSKKIAYRDLKPENLVLDKRGYVKLVDFGLAKVVDGKTWTLCGTPDYLAPEIILNEGHDKAVDYWALGVLIFEMVSGTPPFYADDPMEVYEKILSATMVVPPHFSKNLADLVRKLLKIYQSKRLGNGKGGCSAIQKHKWFSNFDFEGLLRYELPAPFTPSIKDDTDANNFEIYEDESEETPCPEWDPVFE